MKLLPLIILTAAFMSGCQPDSTLTSSDDTKTYEQTSTVVDAYFSGLIQRDMTNVPFSSDAVLISPMAEAPIVGSDNIKELINEAIATLDTANVHRRVIEGEYACVLFDYIDVSGLSVPIVDCFVVNSGEIVELRLSFDPRPFIAAASEN